MWWLLSGVLDAIAVVALIADVAVAAIRVILRAPIFGQTRENRTSVSIGFYSASGARSIVHHITANDPHDRAGTIAVAIIVMGAVAVHVLVVVAPPIVAAVAAVLAAVEAFFALLADIVLALLIVLGSEIEKSLRDMPFELFFIAYPAPQVSFISKFKIREVVE